MFNNEDLVTLSKVALGCFLAGFLITLLILKYNPHILGY